MKNVWITCLVALAALTSCSKQIESLGMRTAPAVNEFVKYTIAQGQHSADINGFQQVQYKEMKFIVKFDSSAIYRTASPSNQSDVNKLYGFSDNNTQHHQYSARFGWRWSNNALRLFGYVYNNGKVSIQELGTVDIGSEVSCAIKVAGNEYVFTLGGKAYSMPRESTTPTAEGYKLYPYFGGDELAPHAISIWIKEVV